MQRIPAWARKLEDIRGFILAQPAATKIGVAYMQNGAAQILQNPTQDHALASKALRLPLGETRCGHEPLFCDCRPDETLARSQRTSGGAHHLGWH